LQRYECRKCGHRFIESSRNAIEKLQRRLYSQNIVLGNQICAIEAKNLENTTETKTVVGDKTKLSIDDPTLKGKLLQYEYWMQKQNLSPETIRLNRTCLKMLIINGANLLDPESTKAALNRYVTSPSRKRNAINAYTQFLKLNKLTWEKPKCQVIKKFPFIPLEKELDALIAASG